MAVNEAWDRLDSDEPESAAPLARAILADHPDAIDAYVVLAATCTVPAEAAALLREAVRIGAAMAGGTGHADPETIAAYDRDAHVRALNHLARLLWYDCHRSNRKEALIHARRALRMDNDDRNNTRILLMAWEAAEGHWAASRRITRSCRKEPRTEIRYWLALHAFRDGTPDAEALLDKAIATNPHVPAALDRRITLLHDRNPYCTWGSPEEAVLYARATGRVLPLCETLMWRQAARLLTRQEEAAASVSLAELASLAETDLARQSSWRRARYGRHRSCPPS